MDKKLPDEAPSQAAPTEAKAIAWGLIAWIVFGAFVVMTLYVIFRH